jgi:catechol 2,3-dioxygenase-like lactoylglutathione lyase family enzyme
MKLGAFSLSLNVQDIEASRAFYGKLDFEPVGGDPAQGWLILRNDTCTLGLFKGMIEKNTLTFNPGWDPHANPLDAFQDVRELQSLLKSEGVDFVSEVDEESSGPASFILIDPDGNPILFDQHV